MDCTPQEKSSQLYQMGPAPLTAIKNGETYVGYDTAFVFAEVNADYVKWIALRDDSGDIVFEGRCIYFQTAFCPAFMRCMHDDVRTTSE